MTLNKEIQYYKVFFVGLMDGDGSIQVNHWRKRSLQFRIVIALKYSPQNFEMLQLLKNKLGVGNVVVPKGEKRVLWVENNRKKIIKILNLFDQYPPLTSRLTCQLLFFRRYLFSPDLEHYLNNRCDKYENVKQVQLNLNAKSTSNLFYFPQWLSGFIEAEGCFTCRQNCNKVPSFSLFQKEDSFLIEEIRTFLGAQSRVRYCPKKKGFSLEIYRRSVFAFLEKHFQENPLLGEKSLQMKNFFDFLKEKSFAQNKCRVVLPL